MALRVSPPEVANWVIAAFELAKVCSRFLMAHSSEPFVFHTRD